MYNLKKFSRIYILQVFYTIFFFLYFHFIALCFRVDRNVHKSNG